MLHLATRRALKSVPLTPVLLGLMFAGLLCSRASAQIRAQVPSGITPTWTKGIQPINRDSYWNAVECGKQGGDNPPCVFYDTGLCKNDDFTLALFTPYKGVAIEVWDAVRRNKAVPTPNYLDAQRTRITLGVEPVKGSKNPITEVVIKRGAAVVKPATQSIDGGTGRFIFDFAAFAPTEAITIDLIGRTATVSCRVERPVLSRFR